MLGTEKARHKQLSCDMARIRAGRSALLLRSVCVYMYFFAFRISFYFCFLGPKSHSPLIPAQTCVCAAWYSSCLAWSIKRNPPSLQKLCPTQVRSSLSKVGWNRQGRGTLVGTIEGSVKPVRKTKKKRFHMKLKSNKRTAPYNHSELIGASEAQHKGTVRDLVCI